MAPPSALPPRIGVTSDESLVVDSVRAALEERGFGTVAVPWPLGQVPSCPDVGLDFGLMVSDLATASRVQQARGLLRVHAARWLVVTGAPLGQVWGAVLEAGARDVVPSGRTLDDVVADLRRVADPDQDHGADGTRTSLVQAWLAAGADRAARAERLSSLTRRERQVLGLLHDGSAVLDIAAVLGVSPSTVRSQVKAILRKLQVNTQLAAAVALQEHVSPLG